MTLEEIERALGERLGTGGNSERSPGQQASHYAPRARLRLEAERVEPGEALLAFGANPPSGGTPMINLSASGNLAEAAANLFGALRELDQQGVERAAVVPIPRQGLGIAINDRLARAATASD